MWAGGGATRETGAADRSAYPGGGSSAGIEAESIRGVEKRERESMAREREEEEEEEGGRRRKEMRRRRRLSLLFSRPDGWRERERAHTAQQLRLNFFFTISFLSFSAGC